MLSPRLLGSHRVAGGLRLGAHLPFGHRSFLVETLSMWRSMSALKPWFGGTVQLVRPSITQHHKATGSLREAQWADSPTEQPVQTLWASDNRLAAPSSRSLVASIAAPARRHSFRSGSREGDNRVRSWHDGSGLHAWLRARLL